MGDLYRQDFSLGVAEDMAEMLSLNESVTVPFNSFSNCLMTKEFAPLNPDAVERKLYAPGVGQVQTIDAAGNHIDLNNITTE